MQLLLDCGNSRLKWGIASGAAQLVQRGVCDYSQAALAGLRQSLVGQSLRSVRFASVIAPEREQTVFAHLQPLQLDVERFVVSPRSGRLRNAYATSETLGVDRWAAAVGAWGRVHGPCLIISSGTATTVDVIEAKAKEEGVYRGGLILPGLDLMAQSLNSGTARLPQTSGRYRPLPDIADTTHDAIASGVIEATCGAIERMGRVVPSHAPWLITGGAAQRVAAALGRRVQPVDDLVLEGLALAAPAT